MSNNNKKVLNEETVKNRIVIPYFQKLGFRYDEIEYEIGFKIHLGLSPINISKTIKDQKKGYLDLLFKKGNQPIFVVETKSSDHPLTEKDKDQAISYARLLDRIAPFAIVSNGINTKIYDTITKDCLDRSDLKKSLFVKNGYMVSLNEELKYDAQKFLFGYNYQNLMEFSKFQTATRMNSLRGSIKDLSKKFIPELYTSNCEVEKEFKNYIKSKKVVFALIGEQGVGKTNLLCNLAIRLINEYPVLFFNCSFLTKGISHAIAEDFSWTFSSDKSHIQIVKRLEDIIKNHSKNLFLILDAIDEWTVPHIDKDLNEFLMRIKDGDIRLIVSCKDSEWPRFLEIAGLPSEFVENSYAGSDKKGNKYNRLPGVYINRLSDDEHKQALDKYKRIYNFSSQLSGAVLEESKLPLMLRVISEICKNTDKEIDPYLNSIELLNKYLNKKLEKVANSNAAKDILRKIGNELYLLNQTEIEESRISDELGVNIGSEEYGSLFSQNILEAKTQTIANRIIRYYFEKIRDFVIVYYSKNWKILDQTQFKIILNEILSKQYGESLLSLYLRKAGQSHLDAFREYNEENIGRCISEYESTIQNEFPQLKDLLFPYGKDNLGMICFFNGKTKSIEGYGFRQTNEKHPEKMTILDIPFYSVLFGPKNISNKIFYEYGTSQIIGNYPHIIINPRAVSHKYIKEQLSKIVKEGKLNEINNIGFAQEKTYDIIYQKGREFGLGDRNQDTIQQISNLSCNEIIDKLEHYRIRVYAEICYIEQLKKEGKIKEEKRGTITSYSYSLSQQDRNEIEINALELVNKKSSCLNFDIPLPKEYYELRNTVGVIKSDREFIGKPLLPIGDLKKPLYQWKSEVADYSDVGIKEYVESFFKNVFNEYRILVETNLDKVKNQLPLYRSLPVHLFAEVSTPQMYVWGNKYPDREIVYTFIESDKEDYEIYINKTDQRLQRIDSSRRMTILSKKGSIKVKWIQFSLVSRLLNEGLSVFKTPVCNYVYNLLNKELKEIKIID